MDIGAQLKHAREARGLSIDALSRSTRVQQRILSAIERNDSVSLPPRPYGRGSVRAYAAEVGLDPDGTVRDFFSQFGLREAPPPARQREHVDGLEDTASSRTWLWPVAAVLAYTTVGLLVIFAGRWALQNRVDTDVVGTTGIELPKPTAAIDRPVAAPQAPATSGISIVLAAERPVWVTAHGDGQRIVYRILQPGERVTLTATNEVRIRAGDAGALTWRINGRDGGPMGQPGEIRTARVTLENASTIK